MTSARSNESTTTALHRPAFIPGVLGAIILLAGMALVDSSWFTYVLYAVSILALIMVVMAVQGKRPLWVIPLVLVAVVWNPILPIEFPETVLRMLHIIGAAIFIAVAVFMRVPEAQPYVSEPSPEDD